MQVYPLEEVRREAELSSTFVPVMSTAQDNSQALLSLPVEIIGVGTAARMTSSQLQIFFKSTLAGCLITFGCICALACGGGISTQIQAESPSFAKVLMGVAFSLGLQSILSLKLELFTGNIMFMTHAILESMKAGSENRLKLVGKVLLVLAVSLVGNAMGSIASVILFGWATGIFKKDPYLSTIEHITELKADGGAGERIARAIGGNFLVCLAILQSSLPASAASTTTGINGKSTIVTQPDATSRFISILLPITTYVAGGFDHSIANFSYFTLSVCYGGGKSGILVETIALHIFGNLIGGSLFTIWIWLCNKTT